MLSFLSAVLTSFVGLLLLSASPAGAQPVTKEGLVNELRCRADQDCQAEQPQGDRPLRRGVRGQPQKRGFEFRSSSEEDRKKLEDLARAGALPSTNLEIFFEYDKADVTPAAKQALQPLGEALADPRLASSSFVLVGHTDGAGDTQYNQTLSERRAAAVKAYLVSSFSIAPERLDSYGRGKTSLKNAANPLAAENRRVQVVNLGHSAKKSNEQ